MASLRSLMFVIALTYYVANCDASLEENASSHVPGIEMLRKLEQLAVRHLESEHTKKHVIVSIRKFEGREENVCVEKYQLLADIADTNCDKDIDGCPVHKRHVFTCNIEYEHLICRQRIPSMITLFITSNNCTSTQQFPDDRHIDDEDPKPVPSNDPEVLDRLDASLHEMNRVTPDKNVHIWDKSLSAKKQIKMGSVWWDINATIVVSDCAKKDHKDLIECEPLHAADNSPRLCNFFITEPKNQEPFRIINIACEGEERYSSVVNDPTIGNKMRVPTYDLNLRKIVQSAVDRLDAHSSHETRYFVNHISKAFLQVVNGKLWQIKAEIALSNCPKGELGCLLIPLKDSERICYIKIWDQPWLPSLETKMNCAKPEPPTPFPSVVDVDPNSRKALALIAESLKRYNAGTPWTHKFILLRSLKAIREDLGDGTLEWKIDAEIVISDCLKKPLMARKKDCRPVEHADPKKCVFAVQETDDGIRRISSNCR